MSSRDEKPLLSEEERAMWRDAMRQTTSLSHIATVAAPLPVLPPRIHRSSSSPPARLDLHGMTEAEAHALLQETILLAAAAGRKKLHVITGLGTGGGGALKRNVPRWLELMPQVASWHTAAPGQGGDGALVVCLKRKKLKAV